MVYPLQIIRPFGKYRIDNQEYLDQFLTDVCSNDCNIEAFVGDKPKRSTVKMSKCQAAYYPCEYCESKGHLLNMEDKALKLKKRKLHEQKTVITNQLAIAQQCKDQDQIQVLKTLLLSVNEAIKDSNKKHNNIVWPASTQNGTKRTQEKILEIVNKIENDDILSIDEAKGIMGRSLLLDIPYFNFVLHSPVEYLHGVCLGVVKRLIILTFNVGETRQRNTTRKLSDVKVFNLLMSKVKMFREFSRRARNLELSVMKGQEYRNIIFLYFVIVIDCIEVEAKERRLWLLLAYLIRLCMIPENEFSTVDKNVMEYCSKNFYDLYERLFHARNYTYYTHVIGCHMPEIRALGPLTHTSAFGFESFYGEIRHAFTPGTISPLKQAFKKILLKRSISHHCCKASIFFSPKETPLESNCYVYTFTDSKYNFFKIKTINNNILECQKVGKYTTSFPETPNLSWEKIGVFEVGGISDEIVHINKDEIAGKVIKVKNYFLTCPNNVLLEK